MPLVRQVSVKLSADGTEAVKVKLAAVAARAEELGRLEPTIKLRVDTAAASVKLAVLRAELRRTAREATVTPAVGGGGIGGLFGRLAGVFGGGGAGAAGAAGSAAPAAGAAGGPALGIGVAAGTGVAITGLLAGAGGIAPALAAASVGLAAFGALAAPTFIRVTGAIGDTKKQLAALPPGIRVAVEAVRGITGEFSGLAKVVQPLVLGIIKDLAPGIKQLVGDLGPFAHAVAPVLDKMAKSFSAFTQSSGFKQFLDQLLKLTGPALTTIGSGIGRVAIAAGKLLVALINPNGLRFLKDTFTTIEWVLQGVAWAIRKVTPITIGFFANTAHAFRDLGRWASDGWHAFAHAMDNIQHVVDIASGAVGSAFGAINRTVTGFVNVVGNATNRAVSWFGGLPGRIASAVGSLGGILYNAGKALLGGLLQGIEAAWNSVASFLSSLAGKIASLKGPLPKDATLLVPHGKAIMGGLLSGMNSMMPELEAGTSRIAATIAGGGYAAAGGRAYAPAGGTVNIYVSVPPTVNPAEAGRQVAELILRHTRNGGHLYPIGVTPR